MHLLQMQLCSPGTRTLLLLALVITKFCTLFRRSHAPLRDVIISWKLIIIFKVDKKIKTSSIFSLEIPFQIGDFILPLHPSHT